MFVLFMRGDSHFFPLFFFNSWYGLGWYRVRGETPQEGICFFLGMEWGWGEEVCLGGMERGGGVGTGKIPFFLLRIHKTDKNLEIFTKL
jgi:hypothetical protein